MRQIHLAVIIVACFALGSAMTFAEDTVHPRGQTGFTDGTNAGPGTQVRTGQEAPQSGATSGAAVIKNKKRKHDRNDHRSTEKSETKSETKTVTE